MFLLDVLRDPMWLPLSQTLLHFLWQGLAVAAGVATLLYVWPVRQSQNRYLIFLSALLAVAACPIVTLLVTETPSTIASVRGQPDPGALPATSTEGERDVAVRRSDSHVVPAEPTIHDSHVPRFEEGEPRAQDPASVSLPPTWRTRFIRYTSTMQPYGLLAWMSGVLLLAIRLSLSYLHVRWIARDCAVIPSDLTAKAKAFCRRLGLTSMPRVCVSNKVRDAIVVGVWRPLVLLPASWLTEMPPEVLEAVLAHELAHIRRFDLWVNLLQRLIEALLFYHPAVWWLSRQVSVAREMCADELAVRVTNDRLVYATALETLGRLRIGRTMPQLAANMSDNKMVLLRRVSNILNVATSREKTRWLPASLLAMTVPTAILFTSMTAGSATEDEARASEVISDGIKNDTSATATSTEANLALEARIFTVDGQSPERASIMFWKAVDPNSIEQATHARGAANSRMQHIWRDSLTGRTWDTIHGFGAGDSATKTGLSPGHYRVTASLGHGDPTMIALSDPIHLDGSRKHTVVTLKMEAGPSLTVEAIDAETGEAIEDASLRLIRTDGLPVVSWSSGRWSILMRRRRHVFRHLTPGVYSLEVFKPAHQFGQTEYVAEEPTKVRLVANQNQQLKVRLEAVAPSEEEATQRWPWSVTGTVTDDNGLPLGGVKVSAHCGMGTLMPTGSATTDNEGRYTLRFSPGMRTLDETSGTWKAGLQVATIHANLAGHTERNLCRQGGLMMTDNPPPSDNSWGVKADEIILPHKPYRLDFVMVPAAKIEGEIVDEQGKPLANTSVSLQGKEMRPSTSVLVSRDTDDQGHFRFEGIPTKYEWWFSIDGQGRTQPITLPNSATYRIKLQSVHDQRHNLSMARIVSVSVPPGAEVRDLVVGDDPSARPPVSEELQAQGREYLKEMALACRDWIAQPPTLGKDVKSFTYRFRLGDQPPQKMEVNVSRAARTYRHGIHYNGIPHLLALHPEKVAFRQVDVAGDKILLRYVVQGDLKVAAGNGITGRFLGYFSSPLREGLLVLDKETFRPLKTDLETFSRYADLGDGRYVPQEIRVRRGAGFWKWTFRVYQPDLWLLDEARLDADGDPVLTIDQVTVNGRPAVKSSLADDLSWSEESRGVSMRLRASKLRWTQGEVPELLADFRNTGNDRIGRLAFLHENWAIELDGQIYRVTMPDPGDQRPLPEFGPGSEVSDIPVPVHESFVADGKPLKWLPGTHSLRVRLTQNETEDEGRYPEIHLVSNPVELVILPKDSETNSPAKQDGAVVQVVRQWLGLVEQGDRDAAADLMSRGKNENADDGLSMSVVLEAAAQGRVSPAKVYAHANRALVTTNVLEKGRYEGNSFIFHLASNLNRQLQWHIHEVSLVSPNEKGAQLEAFNCKPVNQPVDSSGFGPVIERTLKITDSYTDALNLDANRLIQVPNDFDTNRDVTQDPIKWIVVRGADLGPQRTPDRDMELRGIFLQRVRRVGNDVWNQSDAAQVRKLLPAAKSETPSPRWRAEGGSYPVTFVFETMPEPTGTSQQGILQMLAVDPENQTVRLRYKLVGRTANNGRG